MLGCAPRRGRSPNEVHEKMSTKVTLVLAALAFTALLTAPAALQSAGIDVADATPFGDADAIAVCPYTSGDAGDFKQCVGVDVRDEGGD